MENTTTGGRETVLPTLNRPSLPEVIFETAQLWAQRSTCSTHRPGKVGAILTLDWKILATGYNGALPGQEHCDDIGCLEIDGHCVRAVHAEENAILQCAKFGIKTMGTSLWSTFLPCIKCTRMAILGGVSDINFIEEPPPGEMRSSVIELCFKRHIQLRKWFFEDKALVSLTIFPWTTYK